MSLPEQLRAIADRIDAAEAERRAAIGTLAELAGGAIAIVDELGQALDADAAAVMRDGSSIQDTQPGPIEQPAVSVEDAAAGAAPSPIKTPARRSSPATTRVESGPSERPASADPAPSTAPSAVLRPCPDCERSFDSPQGLSLHRRKVHGYQPWAPEPQGTKAPPAPLIRKGGERWVCARCPASFRTTALRDKHQASHPPIPEVKMPVGRGPARTPYEAAQRMLRGGGLGE